MNAWLFTNTFYGTWLPGDARGSVTSVRNRRPEDLASDSRIEHDRIGTPVEGPLPSLERAAIERMKGPPIHLDRAKAEVLLAQFQETAIHRKWRLECASVMWNHVHWVAFISDEIGAARALVDFKAYGSRTLNRSFGRPASGTWWTSKGSKRLLHNDASLAAARDYVLNQQPNPLLTWSAKAET